MQSQTPEQKLNLSVRIEELIDNELKDTISYHINKYKKSFERKLGLTEDDLVNDVREQVWKGLLTWKPNRLANLRTYLNKLIANRFKTLLNKSSITKYSSLEYYQDPFASSVSDGSALETIETGEAIFLRRQEFMKDQETLSEIEQSVYKDLLMGFSINEMVRRHSLGRPEIIGLIKSLTDRIGERRVNTARGAL